MDKITISSIDRKNKYIRINVNPKVYSLQTIFAAGYVFLDRVYILLDQGKNKNIEVYLFPKEKSRNLKKLGLEFCNELLNYAHYFSRVKANAEVIKGIMQRALFSASPGLVEQAEEQEIQDLIKDLEKEDEKTPHPKKRK